MQKDDSQTPLGGKGDELIPDRGISFDRDDDSPIKDVFGTEEDLIDSLENGVLSIKTSNHPFTNPDAPPGNSFDEGMATHREENSHNDNPKNEDGGMTAGYPPDASAPLPGGEIAQPTPESMNGAPIFSSSAYIDPNLNTENNNNIS